MEDVTVRVLGVEEWSDYRVMRLAALKDSPGAFSSRLDEKTELDEQQWRECMVRARRLLAEGDGAGVGVVSVGPAADDEDEDAANVFGLWVTNAARNSGVAWNLVEVACEEAAKQGWSRLYYWVGTQNGRAIGFAANFGFRPTSRRRQTRITGADRDDEQEVAMVLSLPREMGVPNPMGPRLTGAPGPAGTSSC